MLTRGRGHGFKNNDKSAAWAVEQRLRYDVEFKTG